MRTIMRGWTYAALLAAALQRPGAAEPALSQLSASAQAAGVVWADGGKAAPRHEGSAAEAGPSAAAAAKPRFNLGKAVFELPRRAPPEWRAVLGALLVVALTVGAVFAGAALGGALFAGVLAAKIVGGVVGSLIVGSVIADGIGP